MVQPVGEKGSPVDQIPVGGTIPSKPNLAESRRTDPLARAAVRLSISTRVVGMVQTREEDLIRCAIFRRTDRGIIACLANLLRLVSQWASLEFLGSLLPRSRLLLYEFEFFSELDRHPSVNAERCGFVSD